MEEHFQRHKEALELIRAQCAVGMDPIKATKVVVEELGQDVLRASPDESDWDTAHNIVKILVRDYDADILFAMDFAATLFGRASIKDLCDTARDVIQGRLRGGSN
jgi:hypothetical protein